MNTLDFGLLAPTPGVSFHPTFTNLLCTSSVGTDRELGLTDVDLQYEGVSVSDDSALPPPVYTLAGVPYTFPIDTISDIKWGQIQAYIIAEGGQAAFDDAFDDNDRFVKFPQSAGRYAGVEVFDDGGLMWRVDFVSRTSQRGLLSRYQKITSPLGPNPNIEGRNWRLVDFQERELINIYDVSVSYLLSGPNGWDPIIYG